MLVTMRCALSVWWQVVAGVDAPATTIKLNQSPQSKNRQPAAKLCTSSTIKKIAAQMAVRSK
jgi:hypothetical protein